MCGIAGVKVFNSSNPEPIIQTLVNSQIHRGPDGMGIWTDLTGSLALGHNRLSILDTTDASKQPMTYMDQRYWIVFNGEIYNFIEIRKDLIKKGYIFHTQSDTEVILAAYSEWGDKMLPLFNGMWAIAIYDVQEKSLFLSRDRFGVKPLFYYKSSEGFLFASEVQAIHKVLGNQHPLNEAVIKEIANGKFRTYGTELCYLKNVFSVPAGCNLKLSAEVVTQNQWYKLSKVKVPKSFKLQAQVLKELINDSCLLRLRSDVPVGTCLSGGLDSGSIAGTISKLNSEDERFNHYAHRSFCASFPGSTIDEFEKAKVMASHAGSKLTVTQVQSTDIDDIQKAMKQCDGPMHALAFFPIWKLFQNIKKEGITVTLDGQGPDEMLGGYYNLEPALQAAYQMKKPKWFFDVYRTYSLLGESPYFSSRKTSELILQNFYKRKRENVILSISAGYRSFKHFLLKVLEWLRLYRFELIENTVNTHSFPLDRKNNGPIFSNVFDEDLYQQFFFSPLPTILQQYDRCSMAHGVECRMPFMDYRIVEFIFSLPSISKLGKGYTKRILREAVKGTIPESIRLDKNKIGFNAPIVEWFRDPLKEFMLEIMNTIEFENSIYFNGNEIRNNYLSFLSSDNPEWSVAWKFWPPVHLTWWLKFKLIET